MQHVLFLGRPARWPCPWATRELSFRLSLGTARDSACSTIPLEMQSAIVHVERARTRGVQPDAQVSCPHRSVRSSTYPPKRLAAFTLTRTLRWSMWPRRHTERSSAGRSMGRVLRKRGQSCTSRRVTIKRGWEAGYERGGHSSRARRRRIHSTLLAGGRLTGRLLLPNRATVLYLLGHIC
jgi:hypothetical protein